MVTLKFRLEAKMKAGGIYRTYSRRQRAIARKISALAWQTLKLTVCYIRDGKEIGANEGTYHDMASALTAWGAFTEPELLAWMAAYAGRTP